MVGFMAWWAMLALWHGTFGYRASGDPIQTALYIAADGVAVLASGLCAVCLAIRGWGGRPDDH
jgi:hypothetical protein